MYKLAAATIAVLASANAAFAADCSDPFGSQACTVPEISAMEGAAAIAALAAIMLLAWERRRRAS